MKNLKSTVLACLLLLAGVSTSLAQTSVVAPTCEYRVNPIGIDVVKPRLSWKLSSEQRNTTQTAYQIRVAEDIKDLRSAKKALWDSGKVLSDRSIQVEYQGPELLSGQRVYWQVKVWDNNDVESEWSQPAYWQFGIAQNAEWNSSNWITNQAPLDATNNLPTPYFRKEFSADKKIARATAYVSSLGTYQLFINGVKVSDDLFAPGWTSYHNRIQYQTYDVTSMLGAENAIGAIVADGWYRGYFAWGKRRDHYGKRLALILRLKIEYTDGSSQIVTTDGSWKYTYGPILSADIYNGEVYDSRKEMHGWDTPGYIDNKWDNVETLDQPKDVLVATTVELPAVTQTLKPIKIFKTPKGEMVADMGQNMIGLMRIKLSGKRGDTLTFKYAEVLDGEGNFYTGNLRGAKATDTFILNGSQAQVYQPKFTFHGFRYIKFEGLDQLPKAEDITGVVIHTPMAKTGSFETSDPLINQLQSNITWSQRGNFLDIPTDCPQRDERLGWTGDIQAFSVTAAFNYDVANFYTKWLRDVKADQFEDGRVPDVVPNILGEKCGATGWADAAVTVPWTMYKIYGDTRILEQQYESMTSWIGYMEKQAGDTYLWKNGTHYGDWLAYAPMDTRKYTGSSTVDDLIATAFFRQSSKVVSQMAEILGKTDDARRYAELSERIKQAFIKEYVTQNGRLVSHTQTAMLLALAFDLVPEQLRENTAQYLADDFMKFKHLTTGFIGTPLIGNTLSDIGRDDIVFMLLNRREFPSWIYPITMGATTIWERWDGIQPDGNFKGATTMNSFNHYAYGAIGDWMYNHITGIKQGELPAYKSFELAPHVGSGLTSAKASFESMYGTIISDWKIANGYFTYTIAIPANSSAKVVLPNAQAVTVTMGGAPVDGIRQQGADAVITLGSGKYTFTYPYQD